MVVVVAVEVDDEGHWRPCIEPALIPDVRLILLGKRKNRKSKIIHFIHSLLQNVYISGIYAASSQLALQLN